MGGRPAGSVCRKAKWAGRFEQAGGEDERPMEDFSSGLMPKLKRKLFLISYKP
jgi:hypothetical protein